MKFGSVTVVCGGMTIPESFDGSSGKPKKMNVAEKH